MDGSKRSKDPRARNPLRRAALAALAGVTAAGVGAKAFAQGTGGMFGGRRGFGSGDPANAGKHAELRAEYRVRSLLTDINATEEQQNKVVGIVKAAMGDMRPLRDKLFAARKSVFEQLTQPSVDRAGLERLRADQMQFAETASKRFTLALADAAEVLTHEQRTALARRMERRGRWRPPDAKSQERG